MISPTLVLRRTAALGAVAALAVGASGCAGGIKDAATVSFGAGGEKTTVHITRADLEDDLRVLRSNDGFVAFLKQNGIDVPESESSIGSSVAALWLGTLVKQTAVDAEFLGRDLEVAKKDRRDATDQVDQSYGGAEVFAQFPEGFRDAAVERAAKWNVLVADGVAAPTEADAKKFYDENANQPGACASGISVAHILLETEAEAADVKAELDGGADFATLAKERSTDPTAADNGGDLGCLQDGTFVAPFEAAAKASTLGEPTDPVKTEFGYHVILTAPFVAPTFADLKDQILEYLAGQMEQSSGQEMSAIVVERLKGAEVDIDPRYGTWVTDDQQGPHVAEPGVPEPADGRGTPSTAVVPVGPDGTAPAQGG